VKFTDRPEYLLDPALAQRHDVDIALRLHDDYVKTYSPRLNNEPAVTFLEVDRSPNKIDPLWHVQKSPTQEFSRKLQIFAINQFEKPDWRLKVQGIVPQRTDRFWVSRLELVRKDYYPTRGDLIMWNGYRYAVVESVIPPDAYWQQTGVWLGMYVRATINPDGDATANVPMVVNPHEISNPAGVTTR